ncbi:gluconokinase [Thermocoleostomius sinensis]|jgi:gluconokinase|uniref:Gluconokinase n=1 Tax=Thermocoleostomius sinensis A174 TaxID=2016057 RepID=A0A9E8ZCT4_9CYAN|nr:gluconokinase [Thermocoleostomius sinensis]WAL58890.1 gluconokinase [Thermocoleostomius sinensis A174]
MNNSYFIGVDVGTTSTKAIVFSVTGEMKSISNRGYPIAVPRPGWAEQDPEEIFSDVLLAVREAVRQANIAKSEVAAIGFSGAMHSLIAVNAEGQPLTPAIIWADNRSIAQTTRLKQDGTGQALYRRTGTPIHPMSPLTKLLWMREEAIEMFQQAARFISIKEYIFYKLFDRFIVDYSIASATGLFNLKQQQWDAEALDYVGIAPDRLSELVPTTYVLRGFKREYAETMGIDADTPMVVGASDGVLANLGVGAINPRQVAITLGTSGAVRTVVPTPLTDPQGRTFCYALTENHWVIGGPSNNGGIVLRWLRDEFCQTEVTLAKQMNADPYEIMIKAASEIPLGAEGLICLPFLSGERAPYWNAEARGIFFGVGLHHHRAHFIRAVLEGILFSVYSINLALQDLVNPAEEIRASGGFARSGIWLQMAADVFGYDVVVPQVYEGSSFGAAVLAMVAVGQLSQLENVESLIQAGDRYHPHLDYTHRYHQLFDIYDRLYRTNVNDFSLLNQLR